MGARGLVVFFLEIFDFWREVRCELTGQEAVQLDEQLQVDVVRLGRLAVRAADMVCVEIDTY